MSPGLEWDVNLCSINDGMEFAPYEFIKRLVNWISSAVHETITAVNTLYDTLFVAIPSGVAVPILIDGEEITYEMPEKQFWAVQFGFGGIWFPPIPLNKSAKENWHHLLHVIDAPISGSENWYYKDEDTGEVMLGTEYDPIRQYHIFSSGAKDLFPILLVIGITWLMFSMNLWTTAGVFAKKAMAYMKAKKMKKNISDTAEQVKALTEQLAGVTDTDFNNILTSLGITNMTISQLSNRLGVRLISG